MIIRAFAALGAVVVVWIAYHVVRKYIIEEGINEQQS